MPELFEIGLSPRTYDDLHCRECGVRLENTSDNFSACPRGHGRLHPLITKRDVLILAQNKLEKRPAAVRIEKPKRPARYLIDGKRYRLVAAIGLKQAVNRMNRLTTVVARCPQIHFGYGEFTPAE